MPLFVIDQPADEEESAQPAPAGAEAIGQAAGVHWYRDTTIPAEGREPTDDELAAALLQLPAIRQLKQMARRRIEAEVGDVYDLLADQGKQIEALTALVARMAVEYYGGEAASEETRANYLARSQAVVDALDSGGVSMRSDAEPAYDMIMRALNRSGQINRIIADDYLPRRDQVLS